MGSCNVTCSGNGCYYGAIRSWSAVTKCNGLTPAEYFGYTDAFHAIDYCLATSPSTSTKATYDNGVLTIRSYSSSDDCLGSAVTVSVEDSCQAGAPLANTRVTATRATNTQSGANGIHVHFMFIFISVMCAV